uniref:BACK domain-containing protein n=1 Tax=Rhizochromulina marina TaxID=1034831 RepID=A0A7S2SSH9_9STRA|mmetsp:Transcript_6306/g.18439  ORF Transcript_6306/g.18439 Transcript_6306/m.18439 type:complete len:642 (+) Transcript_6306:115-2040(+)
MEWGKTTLAGMPLFEEKAEERLVTTDELLSRLREAHPVHQREVVNQCCEALVRVLDGSNCCKILEQSNRVGCRKLYQAALNHIISNLDAACESDEFYRLSPRLVLQLVQSISPYSEQAAVQAVQRYIAVSKNRDAELHLIASLHSSGDQGLSESANKAFHALPRAHAPALSAGEGSAQPFYAGATLHHGDLGRHPFSPGHPDLHSIPMPNGAHHPPPAQSHPSSGADPAYSISPLTTKDMVFMSSDFYHDVSKQPCLFHLEHTEWAAPFTPAELPIEEGPSSEATAANLLPAAAIQDAAGVGHTAHAHPTSDAAPSRDNSATDDPNALVDDVPLGPCTPVVKLLTCQRVVAHESHVLALESSSDFLFSASSDDIRVWHRIEGTCSGILRGHHGSVLCLAFRHGNLVSGSRDCTVNIWGSVGNTWTCIQSLRRHADSVQAVVFWNGVLASGSSDKTIRLWANDFQQWTCAQVLLGHEGGVQVLQVVRGKLFSGSQDCTIRVWATAGGATSSGEAVQSVAVLRGHRSGITALCSILDDTGMASASMDCRVLLWNMDTLTCVAEFGGDQPIVRSLQAFGKHLLCGDETGQVHVWNVENGGHEAAFKVHDNPVTDIHQCKNTFVSGSWDGDVAIWGIFASDHSGS